MQAAADLAESTDYAVLATPARTEPAGVRRATTAPVGMS